LLAITPVVSGYEPQEVCNPSNAYWDGYQCKYILDPVNEWGYPTAEQIKARCYDGFTVPCASTMGKYRNACVGDAWYDYSGLSVPIYNTWFNSNTGRCEYYADSGYYCYASVTPQHPNCYTPQQDYEYVGEEYYYYNPYEAYYSPPTYYYTYPTYYYYPTPSYYSFCSLAANPTNINAGESSEVTIYYSGLAYEPYSVFVDCGNGYSGVAFGCYGTTGMCFASCSYSSAGTYYLSAFSGGAYCTGTSVIVKDQTQPYYPYYPSPTYYPTPTPSPQVYTPPASCSVLLNPSTIAGEGSTTATIVYSNMQSAPATAPIICGNGDLETAGCSGSAQSGSCTGTCNYAEETVYPKDFTVQSFIQGTACVPSTLHLVSASNTGSAKIHVTNCLNGQGINGATVNGEYYTDSSGFVTIPGLSAGAHTFTASKQGFHSASVTATVVRESTVDASVCLNPISSSCSVSVNPSVVRGGGTTSVTVNYFDLANPVSSAQVNCGNGESATGTCGGGTTGTCTATCPYGIESSYPKNYVVDAAVNGVSCGSANVKVISPIETTGTVLVKATACDGGAAIKGAKVQLNTVAEAYYTDANGEALVAGVPTGAVTATVSKQGYSDASATASVSAGKTVVLPICISLPSCSFEAQLVSSPVCPSKQNSFQIKIKNNGNASNTVSIKVSGAIPITAPGSVSLDAGEEQVVSVEANPPEDVVGSSAAIVSLAGSGCTKNIELPICLSGKLSLEAIEPVQNALPNEDACFELTVRNRGSDKGLVSLSAAYTEAVVSPTPTPSPKPREVLVIGTPSQELENELESNRYEDENISYAGSLMPNELSDASLDNINITILQNTGPCNSSAGKIISDYAEEGGKVVVIGDACRDSAGVADVIPVSYAQNKECVDCGFRKNAPAHAVLEGITETEFEGDYTETTLKSGASLIASLTMASSIQTGNRLIAGATYANGTTIAGAEIRLYDINDFLVSTGTGDARGEVVFEVNSSEQYYLTATKTGFASFNGRSAPFTITQANTYKRIVLQPLNPVDGPGVSYDNLVFDVVFNKSLPLAGGTINVTDYANVVKVSSNLSNAFKVNGQDANEVYLLYDNSGVVRVECTMDGGEQVCDSTPIANPPKIYFNSSGAFYATSNSNKFTYYYNGTETVDVGVAPGNADARALAEIIVPEIIDSQGNKLQTVLKINSTNNSVQSVSYADANRGEGFVTDRGNAFDLLNDSTFRMLYANKITGEQTYLTSALGELVNKAKSTGLLQTATKLFVAGKTVLSQNVASYAGVSSIRFNCTRGEVSCGDDVVFTKETASKSVAACGGGDNYFIAIEDDAQSAASECEILAGITPGVYKPAIAEKVVEDGRSVYFAFDPTDLDDELLLNAINYLAPQPVVPTPATNNAEVISAFKYSFEPKAFIISPQQIKTSKLCVHVPSGASGSYSFLVKATSPINDATQTVEVRVPVLDVGVASGCPTVGKGDYATVNITNNVQSGDYTLEIGANDLGAQIVQDTLYNFVEDTTRTVYLKFEPQKSGTQYMTLLMKKGDVVVAQKQLCFNGAVESKTNARVVPNELTAPRCEGREATFMVRNLGEVKQQYTVTASQPFNSIVVENGFFSLNPGEEGRATVFVAPKASVAPGDYVVSVTAVPSQGASNTATILVHVTPGCIPGRPPFIVGQAIAEVVSAEPVFIGESGQASARIVLKNDHAVATSVVLHVEGLPANSSSSQVIVELAAFEQKTIQLNIITAHVAQGIYQVKIVAESGLGRSEKEMEVIVREMQLDAELALGSVSIKQEDNQTAVLAVVTAKNTGSETVSVHASLEGMPEGADYEITPFNAVLAPGEEKNFNVKLNAMAIEGERTVFFKLSSSDGKTTELPISISSSASPLTGLFTLASSQALLILVIVLLAVAAYFVAKSRRNVSELKTT
jgi:uncharacterized membrane protein